MSEQMVQRKQLVVNVDDRGTLFEILRSDDPRYEEYGQLYMVKTRGVGTIRAFHRHLYTWDHFCIVSGASKFLFVDAAIGAAPSPSDPVYEITTSSDCPVRLDVPPGVWHGHMTLAPDTLLASIASTPYMGNGRSQKADEERVDPYFFDDAREMWRVIYK